MNVFYEEDGGFKAATILADNDSSLQVEAPHGKRSKIKSSSIMLRFDRPPPADFMSQAQAAAGELDVDFLWQCSTGDEFAFGDLAREYFGHDPSPAESAAVLICLHGAPMYFYKKGRGRFKAAPEENLRAALAGQERKRRQEEQKARWIDQLLRSELPDEFRTLRDNLLFDPDKNSLEWKALDEACHRAQLSVPRMFASCGALSSSRAYHVERFVRQTFAGGLPTCTDLPPPDPELAEASASAFSIDDASTTEIDDAFSVVALDNGHWRVGVHIAAPALGILPGTPLDRVARTMLSTVYMPGDKITMLPNAAVERYTLAEGVRCPVVSMYLTINPDFEIVGTHSVAERIMIAANLRHDTLERDFNEASLGIEGTDYPFRRELNVLWHLANRLEAKRGKADKGGQIDYVFRVEGEHVSIAPRPRGTPIDRVVSELMILVNTEWGRELAADGIGAIYRTQRDGRTAMSLEPGPHQGLGVPQYAWSSSPLRRYVDLVNQRQLLALLRGEEAPYGSGDEELMLAMRDFELAYDAYAEFQRSMERYWCVRYVAQEGLSIVRASVLRESLVRIDGLPLVCRVPGLPTLPTGSAVEVELSHVDEWEPGVHCQFRNALN